LFLLFRVTLSFEVIEMAKMKHEDVAADKALIKKTVKKEAAVASKKK